MKLPIELALDSDNVPERESVLESSVSQPIVWRFGDRPEDGDAWLANPELVFAYVDFQLPDSQAWHRLVVATDRRGWKVDSVTRCG